MFLSFLKRERERDFANVSDRCISFNVPDRYHERSGTVMVTVRNGERSGTLNGQERQGNSRFKIERITVYFLGSLGQA